MVFVIPRGPILLKAILQNVMNEGPHRKESGKRGRKPGRKSAEKVDMKAKLEELVADREKAVFALRKELEKYLDWAKELDEGRIPEGAQELVDEIASVKQES
ncbi:camp-responsive element-binding protein-like 2 [Holotrichia oblita]|uniref:Camp-responsive element-binding protein-like 2 n=1 Tax=Holotrichia oblita TaxID=644536 RepID=A0ACB9T2Z3_HOLOL|nr:camp-responsive element-binding protein-like 2 [Holotrichia oblita]